MKTQKYINLALVLISVLALAACQKDATAQPVSKPAADIAKSIKQPAKTKLSTDKMRSPNPDLNLPAAVKLPQNASAAFLSFRDLKVHVGQAVKGTGQYVLGSIKDGHFIPKDSVLGLAPIKPKGARAPGWLELADGSFHMAATGRPPFPPFVSGVFYTESGFVSSSKTITR